MNSQKSNKKILEILKKLKLVNKSEKIRIKIR